MKSIYSRRALPAAFHRSWPLPLTLPRTIDFHFRRSLLAGLLCCLSSYFLATNTYGAFGDLVTSYSYPASSLVMSPTQPLMYATIPAQNSIVIINTDTLAVETVPVGSGPTNLAFSPDGSKAYIANSSSNFVVVFDTQTRTVVNSFSISEHPQDVVFANQNRLFVLGESHIFQIDATTGASTGPSVGHSVHVYSGSLEISADRNTLYYGQYGLSPTTMYKFDISGMIPVLLRRTQTGENGEDLTLSHDGNSICHPNGAPYLIAKYRTSDFATLGSFNTGPYPIALCFSQDDLVAYASVATAGGIKVFDANTFVSNGSIIGPNGGRLAVDSTGRYLFAGNNGGTQVYDTGRNATVISAPTADAASNVVSSGFTANWTTVTVRAGYRLDVSRSSTFGTYVTGYQDRDVGNVTNFSVSGLSPGTTYYYRVRGYGPPGTSKRTWPISNRSIGFCSLGICAKP
jgi:YVTN family beta-propeller protein